MQKQAVFDITVSETYTEEAVTVTVKATSPSSAQSYGDVLAAQTMAVHTTIGMPQLCALLVQPHTGTSCSMQLASRAVA